MLIKFKSIEMKEQGDATDTPSFLERIATSEPISGCQSRGRGLRDPSACAGAVNPPGTLWRVQNST